MQDLKAHQKSKEAEFARTRASVFQKLSVVELSIFILLGLWDKLADHYVDYSGGCRASAEQGPSRLHLGNSFDLTHWR